LIGKHCAIGILCVVVIALRASDTLSAESPQNLQGLSARLTTGDLTVPMGARVEFSIELTFDPQRADSSVGILNRSSWSCFLTFRKAADETEFRRDPFDVGMLRVQRPEDLVHLRQQASVAESLTVHLLSDDGQQIPPGTYDVTATYENDAGEELEVYVEPETGSSRQRPYAGPWRFWKGRIASAPLQLTITPAEPARVVLQVPSMLTVGVSRDSSQIWWTWDADSKRPVEVTRRPGYALGHRYNVRVLTDGTDTGYESRGMGGTGWRGTGRSLLPPDISAPILSGAGMDLVLDIEVFESSVQPRHLWAPEHGDFRILWKDEIRASFPDDE
jgi:hypothetical protein